MVLRARLLEIAKDMLSRPTAPFREAAMREYVKAFCRERRTIRALAALALAAVVVANLMHLAILPLRINANYNHFCWEPRFFTEHAFLGDQRVYTWLLARKYQKQEALAVALRQANDARSIRSTAAFVFPDQSLSLRNIGIVSESFCVWVDKPAFRIESFAPELRGSILVDNLSLPLRSRGLMKPDRVRAHSEYLDKLQNPAPAQRLAVLTRTDLQVLLFSPPDQPPPPIDGLVKKTNLTIRVKGDGQSLTLQGYLMENYVELPLKSLSPRSFFVLRTR